MKRPDLRQQLRESLAWYEEVLGRIEEGAIVAPGEQERLMEEASAVAHLLDLLGFERGRARQLDRVQDAVNSRAAQGARGLCNVSDMISPVAAVATVAKDD